MRIAVFAVLLPLAVGFASPAAAQSKNLAPGFSVLPKGAKVAIMPVDIELFSISGGGILEPRADWTDAATGHFKSALRGNQHWKDLAVVEVSDKDADELAEINNLHAAVARAINAHHYGLLPLPTKNGKLDWSMSDAVQPVKKATGADYAVFSWIRDSYASAERQAAMVAIAILSMGRAIASGGQQIGYASLVDLNDGRILWFGRLARNSGDLREATPAMETVEALLSDFPPAK